MTEIKITLTPEELNLITSALYIRGRVIGGNSRPERELQGRYFRLAARLAARLDLAQETKTEKPDQ